MRILFYLENPSFCDFFEFLEDYFPLFSNLELMQNLLYLLVFCNFNNHQNSHLQNFWNSLARQTKINEENKIFFIKSLSLVLSQYALCLKSLYNDPKVNGYLGCLNNQSFHFLTPEVLTSNFLNNVCQISISTLMQNVASLASCLNYFYEVFIIIKDNSIKNRIISFITFLFEKKEVLEKIFLNEDALKNILSRGFLEENNAIFLNFLYFFNENILKDENINFNFRNRFFKEIKAYISDIPQMGLSFEYKNKLIKFFCVFFQKLAVGTEVLNCNEFFQIGRNPKFFEEFISEKVIFLN